METEPKLKRRWLQFSLRSLLIFTVVCAVAAGWLGRKIERERHEREAAEANSADQARSSINLKQIATAMLNFHLVSHSFPAAYSTSKEGKRLLSWRVQILPYIGKRELYKQFRLDEPWDSEHNKALIAKMPKVYAAAGSKTARDFETVYLVPHSHSGDRDTETMFPDDKTTPIDTILAGR